MTDHRWIIESNTDSETRRIRYSVVDVVTGVAWDARDFGYAERDFATAEQAEAFRDVVEADIG